ncbi:MAG: aspartate kinase [Anaerolineae bacterium]|nr:aspartate kinase [Anaerolineae bacterium]
MDQKTVIHKFGGTSVGSAERFAGVAEIMKSFHTRHSADAYPHTVVVVSAMSGVTNQLISGAWAAAEGREREYITTLQAVRDRHSTVVRALLPGQGECDGVLKWIHQKLSDLERLYQSIAILGEFTARGQDQVAAFGELLSVHILASVLREYGIASQAMSATQLFVTDDRFGNAAPLMDLTRSNLRDRVQPLLDSGFVPVITGFIAATESGVTTTLGRGGSDYTAAIIAAGLGADEVWIWSDVDGILTADPNLVPGARPLRELSYSEAAELAYYGANVLHPKTIRPVIAHAIPLRILNSFNPDDPGTLIGQDPCPERERFPAIISTTGLSMIAVGTTDDAWSLNDVARVLSCLNEGRIDVLMFSQSFSEHNLNLIVPVQDQILCTKALQNAFKHHLQEGSWKLEIKDKVATVSVVGSPGCRETGSVSKAFAALGKLGVRVIAVAQAATENSVSFCIPEDTVKDTVRFLHSELGLGCMSAE